MQQSVHIVSRLTFIAGQRRIVATNMSSLIHQHELRTVLDLAQHVSYMKSRIGQQMHRARRSG